MTPADSRGTLILPVLDHTTSPCGWKLGDVDHLFNKFTWTDLSIQ